MNETHRLGPVFRETFTQTARRLVIDALAAAYETAVDHHDPSRGSNEVTFGFNLYHFAVHEIARREGSQLCVVSRQPSFRFRLGQYELACHRVGSSERQSIWSAFPNGDSAAYTMLEEQLWLPGMAEDRAVQNARRLVLAHLGNAEDGFRAAYLCIPGRTEGTQIVEWAFTENIWSADERAAASGTEASEAVPEETIDEPVVRRKMKRDVTDAENG